MVLEKANCVVADEPGAMFFHWEWTDGSRIGGTILIRVARPSTGSGNGRITSIIKWTAMRYL
jgi:hypothetical protein